MATQTSPIKQITGGQRLMSGVGLFQPQGQTSWVKIGPCGTVELTPNVTTEPVYTSENGIRQLLRKMVTLQEATLTINDMSSWSEFLYQAQAVATKAYYTQAAVTDAVFECPAAIGVYKVPGRNGDVSLVTDDLTTTYVEGTHYTWHSPSSTLEVLALPAGAGTTLDVTYDLPAITEADGLLQLDLMSAGGGVRGAFRYIGRTKDGNGVPMDMLLPDVEFLPNGAMSVGDTEKPNVASLTASVYASSGSYGTITSIEKIVV